MKVIREYIHINLRKEDNEISAKNMPLTDEELTQYDTDNSYHLLIGKSNTHRVLNGCIEDLFNCRVRLYVSATSSEVEEYDKAYCRALSFRKQLVMPSNVSQNEYVEYVEPIDVIPSTVKDNDRIFIFDINIKIKLAFDISQ